MKKVLLPLLIIVAAGRVLAQDNAAQTKPKSPVSVILKTDTVVYPIDPSAIGYQRIDQLLKSMPSFAVDSAGSVTYQDQPVKKIAINGRPYSGLDLTKFIKRLPANLLDNMELIDDYSNINVMNSMKYQGPDKVLNLNIKRSVMEDLEYYLSNRPSRPLYSRGRYDNPDLYGTIYVDEHNPLDRRTNRAIASMLAISDQMHEVDQYGDQLPHFLIRTPYPAKDVMLKKDAKARSPKAIRLNP